MAMHKQGSVCCLSPAFVAARTVKVLASFRCDFCFQQCAGGAPFGVLSFQGWWDCQL